MDKCGGSSAMVKQLLLILMSATCCIGQALYTFRDPAFMAAVAPPTPIFSPSTNSGMVAYWKFNGDITNTLAYDSSGLGRTGVLNLAQIQFVQNTNADYTGLTNLQSTNVLYGYYYNGFVECGNPHNNSGLDVTATNGDFSLSQWMLWDQNNASLQLVGNTFGYDSFTGVNPARWELVKPSVQGMQWNVSIGTNSISLSGDGGVPFVWKHVVLSKIGSNYSMYVNGALYASTNFSTPLTASASPYLRIGGSPSYSSRGWRGWIGETILWKGYGLTGSDAYDLYHSYYGAPIHGPGGTFPNITNNLIVYFKMDEGSGIPLHNDTTNGTDGWVAGAQWAAKGHNHPYCLNFAQGGFASTAQLNSYDIITNNNHTFAMWLCHTGTATGFETMLYKNTSVPDFPNPQLQRYVSGGGVDVFSWKIPTGPWQPWGFQRFNNTWVFLVMTKQGGIHTWYMCHDGIIESTTANYGDWDDQTPFAANAQYMIGDWAAQQWQGYIEEFRMHRNYCLSSNEVWYLYNKYYTP